MLVSHFRSGFACAAMLASIGCGGAAGVAAGAEPEPRSESPAAVEAAPPRVVRGEWTHVELGPGPAHAAGIVAFDGRVFVASDDFLGGLGARLLERTPEGWAPRTLSRSSTVHDIVASPEAPALLLAEPLGPSLERASIRLHSAGASEEVTMTDLIAARGLLVADSGRTIVVHGLRSATVLERRPSGWQTLAELDAFAASSAALDAEGNLHVFSGGRALRHFVVDRSGDTTAGELDGAGSAGRLASCGDFLYAALGTLGGLVLARLESGRWALDELGVPGAPSALAFDAACRPFIATVEGVHARGADRWAVAPLGGAVAQVRGLAATETHVHVVYERSTSPQEVWVASAALGPPDA